MYKTKHNLCFKLNVIDDKLTTVKNSLTKMTNSLTNNLDNMAVVSEDNSTSSPLGISETFTGVFFDTMQYSEFTILYNADANGTLYMDVSTDGVSATITKTIKNANVGVHTLVITGHYMRIRWDNGLTAQSSFSLQTMFHKFKSKELTSTTSQLINDKNDVTLSRTVNDPILDMARGVISDKFVVHTFGRNPNVGTSYEDIWDVGGDYNFLTSATTLEIVTSDADDDSTGLGARTVVLEGIDENGLMITETVSLTTAGPGTTGPTTNLFYRLNRAYVSEVGTIGGSNFDDIVIQGSSGGVIISRIVGLESSGSAMYGTGHTQLGIYAVPYNHKAYVTRVEINVDVSTNKNASLALYKRETNLDVSIPVKGRTLLWAADNITGYTPTIFRSYIVIDGPADIWFRAKASATASITVNFDLIIVDLSHR